MKKYKMFSGCMMPIVWLKLRRPPLPLLLKKPNPSWIGSLPIPGEWEQDMEVPGPLNLGILLHVGQGQVLEVNLSNKKIEKRRAMTLCFFCEKKYFPRHKCSAQVYRLEVSNDKEGEKEETDGEIEVETSMSEETLQLSLSALNGISAYHESHWDGEK